MDWKDQIKKAVGLKPKDTTEHTAEEERRKT